MSSVILIILEDLNGLDAALACIYHKMLYHFIKQNEAGMVADSTRWQHLTPKYLIDHLVPLQIQLT